MTIKELLLNEMAIDKSGKIELKYYAFDIDDNLFKMPTKIKAINKLTKNREELTTEEFAIARTQPDKYSFDDQSFSDFRPEGDKKFLEDIVNAQKMPAFIDFEECVRNGGIFAIITARGHSPKVLKEGLKKIIKKEGMESDLIDSLKKHYEKSKNKKEKTDDKLLNEYFDDFCRYYPVSYPGPVSGLPMISDTTAANPEERKKIALEDFIGHVTGLARMLEIDLKKEKIKVGFSDDDEKNVITAIKFFQDYEKNLKKTNTIDDLYNDYEFTVKKTDGMKSDIKYKSGIK
jgi:hypothetical protein